ncbi:MAG: tRNA (adenine(22)-N(1))-methyltransferase TrmK [Acholeplasmataceae bacterium]
MKVENNRILHIANLTKGYHTVIDIGSDHGLVLKKAFDLGFIKKGISTDINEGPLLQAKENLKNYNVKYYLTDGFKNINETFDLAIITGMGPDLIYNIIKNENKEIDYILGPNQKPYLLRKLLLENNFKIIEETIVYDRFFYIFLKVKKGVMNLSESEIYTGVNFKNKSLFKKYFLNEIKKINEIINNVKKERVNELTVIKSYYENMVNKL